MKTQEDLALSLGIGQSSVSSAKKRKTFPEKWGIKLAEKHHLSLDSLLRGIPEQPSPEKGSIESVYERLLAEKDKLLEAKDRELELLRNCDSNKKKKVSGNGKTDLDGFGLEKHKNGNKPESD